MLVSSNLKGMISFKVFSFPTLALIQWGSLLLGGDGEPLGPEGQFNHRDIEDIEDAGEFPDGEGPSGPGLKSCTEGVEGDARLAGHLPLGNAPLLHGTFDFGADSLCQSGRVLIHTDQHSLHSGHVKSHLSIILG